MAHRRAARTRPLRSGARPRSCDGVDRGEHPAPSGPAARLRGAASVHRTPTCRSLRRRAPVRLADLCLDGAAEAHPLHVCVPRFDQARARCVLRCDLPRLPGAPADARRATEGARAAHRFLRLAPLRRRAPRGSVLLRARQVAVRDRAGEGAPLRDGAHRGPLGPTRAARHEPHDPAPLRPRARRRGCTSCSATSTSTS